MNQDKRTNLLLESLKLDTDNELISMIVENVANVKVEDVGRIKGDFEVFMNPSGITERELENLQTLFTVKEIGIYGDPDLPEDTVYFHMILSLD